MPRSYHHGDLANALRREARVLVEEHGTETFSLREAAARCGVAVSSAYKHYGSKADLLVAVAQVGFGELGDQIDRRVRRVTGDGVAAAEARLIEMGRMYISYALAHPNLFRLMYGHYQPGGPTRAQLASPEARRIMKLLLGALQAVLEASGRAIGDAELAASRVIAWSAVHGFSMMVLDGMWPRPGKRVLDNTITELGRSVVRALR